jgi:hypothetical protein
MYYVIRIWDFGQIWTFWLKKLLNPFCFACTLGLLPCLLPLHKAKRVQLNGKTLQVL